MDLLLPDNVVETARQYLHNEHDARWALGDFLSDVVTEMEPVYHTAGVKHPRAVMFRQIANSIGCDPSTLRDRQSMAEFFPAQVRSKYDMLTWAQLRACRSAGPEWERYAEWSAANLPAPCAIIRSRIKNAGDLPAVWVSRWSSMQAIADLLMGDEQAPPGVRLTARLISMGILGGV
jgi:hypothetical protein